MEPKLPCHIFIVENNGLFVKLLDYIFSKNILYRFLDFKSGEDCLKNLHLKPEIVVIDYTLPGMNGFETLQELKEQKPDAHVIILLSKEDGRLPAEFFNAGAAECVIKDGNEEEALKERIENFLKKTSGSNGKKKSGMIFARKKLYYALLILILLSLGVYYYQ